MFSRVGPLTLLVFLAASLPCLAQSPAAASPSTSSAASSPDPTSILAQSLAASGAGNVSAYTAGGTITYFGAGKQVQASATVSGRGSDEFRIDANVPGGTQSIAVSQSAGARKEASGELTTIPVHNTLSMGGSAFPYLSIAAALSNPSSFTVSYVGLASFAGQQAYDIRIARNVSASRDPDGIVAKLSQTDYFIDPQTLLVVKTTDLIHPIQTMTQAYPREVDLSGYTTIGGVAVPTTAVQQVSGQPVWEFQISTITFNPNLTDSDFTIQ